MRRTFLRYFLSVLIVFVTVDSLIKNVTANETSIGEGEEIQDESHSNEKRLDKLKYFGGLGRKRTIENNLNEIERMLNEYSDESADQDRTFQKRLDKLRYYGGLGKRSNVRRNYFKKSKNDIDRLRFMGNLGK